MNRKWESFLITKIYFVIKRLVTRISRSTVVATSFSYTKIQRFISFLYTTIVHNTYRKNTTHEQKMGTCKLLNLFKDPSIKFKNHNYRRGNKSHHTQIPRFISILSIHIGKCFNFPEDYRPPLSLTGPPKFFPPILIHFTLVGFQHFYTYHSLV